MPPKASKPSPKGKKSVTVSEQDNVIIEHSEQKDDVLVGNNHEEINDGGVSEDVAVVEQQDQVNNSAAVVDDEEEDFVVAVAEDDEESNHTSNNNNHDSEDAQPPSVGDLSVSSFSFGAEGEQNNNTSAGSVSANPTNTTTSSGATGFMMYHTGDDIEDEDVENVNLEMGVVDDEALNNHREDDEDESSDEDESDDDENDENENNTDSNNNDEDFVARQQNEKKEKKLKKKKTTGDGEDAAEGGVAKQRKLKHEHPFDPSVGCVAVQVSKKTKSDLSYSLRHEHVVYNMRNSIFWRSNLVLIAVGRVMLDHKKATDGCLLIKSDKLRDQVWEYIEFLQQKYFFSDEMISLRHRLAADPELRKLYVTPANPGAAQAHRRVGPDPSITAARITKDELTQHLTFLHREGFIDIARNVFARKHVIPEIERLFPDVKIRSNAQEIQVSKDLFTLNPWRSELVLPNDLFIADLPPEVINFLLKETTPFIEALRAKTIRSSRPDPSKPIEIVVVPPPPKESLPPLADDQLPLLRNLLADIRQFLTQKQQASTNMDRDVKLAPRVEVIVHLSRSGWSDSGLELLFPHLHLSGQITILNSVQSNTNYIGVTGEFKMWEAAMKPLCDTSSSAAQTALNLDILRCCGYSFRLRGSLYRDLNALGWKNGKTIDVMLSRSLEGDRRFGLYKCKNDTFIFDTQFSEMSRAPVRDGVVGQVLHVNKRDFHEQPQPAVGAGAAVKNNNNNNNNNTKIQPVPIPAAVTQWAVEEDFSKLAPGQLPRFLVNDRRVLTMNDPKMKQFLSDLCRCSGLRANPRIKIAVALVHQRLAQQCGWTLPGIREKLFDALCRIEILYKSMIDVGAGDKRLFVNWSFKLFPGQQFNPANDNLPPTFAINKNNNIEQQQQQQQQTHHHLQQAPMQNAASTIRNDRYEPLPPPPQPQPQQNAMNHNNNSYPPIHQQPQVVVHQANPPVRYQPQQAQPHQFEQAMVMPQYQQQQYAHSQIQQQQQPQYQQQQQQYQQQYQPAQPLPQFPLQQQPMHQQHQQMQPQYNQYNQQNANNHNNIPNQYYPQQQQPPQFVAAAFPTPSINDDPRVLSLSPGVKFFFSQFVQFLPLDGSKKKKSAINQQLNHAGWQNADEREMYYNELKRRNIVGEAMLQDGTSDPAHLFLISANTSNNNNNAVVDSYNPVPLPQQQQQQQRQPLPPMMQQQTRVYNDNNNNDNHFTSQYAPVPQNNNNNNNMDNQNQMYQHQQQQPQQQQQRSGYLGLSDRATELAKQLRTVLPLSGSETNRNRALQQLVARGWSSHELDALFNELKRIRVVSEDIKNNTLFFIRREAMAMFDVIMMPVVAPTVSANNNNNGPQVTPGMVGGGVRRDRIEENNNHNNNNSAPPVSMQQQQPGGAYRYL